MLVVRATAYQTGLRRLREQALMRLTPDLLKLALPPVWGHKRSAQEADLAAVDLVDWQVMVDRLGWQVSVTNTTPDQYDVPALVAAYHQQPVHERTFSRLKTRNLHLCPVFVRDETRNVGLVWLLCLALRILVLTEQCLRAALQEQGTELAGLNPASRTQTTTTPTTERVIRAFRHLTVTVVLN